MKRTLYWLGGIGAAAVLALGLNHMREDSPRVIKSYTENGREITLLDLDGNPATAEERVTSGRFPAFGSEPPVGGSTKKREFEPPIEIDGRKINTEISFYDKNRKRVEGPIRTLEPREGGLEIHEKPETTSASESAQEAELSSYERIKEYLEEMNASKLNITEVVEQDVLNEKIYHVRFYDRDDDDSMMVSQTIDQFSVSMVRTRARGVHCNLTISEYGKGAETVGWFYQGVEGGNMFNAIIEGDDLVLKEIGYENDPERHCNDPFAKKDTKNNHNLLHDFDDLEVGTRLPGLGKKLREIYEAFNKKAKEAVERQSK